MSISLRRLVVAAALAATVVVPVAVSPADAATATGEEDTVSLAPVLGTGTPDRIDDHYIVVLRDSTPRRTERATRRTVSRLGGDVLTTYRSALTGFSARLSPRALAVLRRDPTVAYVEADRRVSIAGDRTETPWGLDRIDQHQRPADGAYHFDLTGAGVTAYVVDTGIRADHVTFGDRVQAGFSSVRDGNGTEDCRRGTGHGTHVAGTIGSDVYGVAPGVSLVPVRVLDCYGSGRWSAIIKGVDWVKQHHEEHPGPAVANMSLTGPRGSRALVDAVNAAITSGVTFAVAAGNDYDEACRYIPAGIKRALSVGATNRRDKRAAFSNHGPCVDLFAPGVGVTSASIRSRWSTEKMSGTSMASPHVAGVAALVLEADPAASPASVRSTIVTHATRGVVEERGRDTPNLLLYANFLATSAPEGNALANPGFETGDAVWRASGGTIRFASGREHSGAWAACLGGAGATTHRLAQTVTLPAGTPSLSLWLDVRSSESPAAGSASDTLRLEAVVGGEAQLLGEVTDLDETGGYVPRSYDLGDLAGRTVTLRLTSDEDASLRSTFCVDDAVVD